MTLNYIFESTVCWLFFYLLYAFWLRKETFFRTNRVYLITTLLLGLLIPAIDLMPTQQPIVIQDFTVYLNEVTVLAQGNAATSNTEFDIGAILVAVYKVGIGIFLLRFLVSMANIFRLFINSKIIKKENYTLVYTSREHAPFSFMNFFFVYKKMNFSEAEWQQITRHEEAHIRGAHTLDVLLVEVLTMLFWFNPLIYMYKYAMRNIHEYLADAAVIKTVPTVHYGQFLVSFALPGFRMANNFNHSQLKKRIIMMTKTQSSKFALAKYILFIPLALMLLVIFSCKEETENLEAQSRTIVEKQESNQIEPIAYETNPVTGKIVKSKSNKETETNPIKMLEKEKIENDIRVIEQEKNPDKRKALISGFKADVKKKTGKNINFGVSEDTDVYIIVDEMPLFPGCGHEANVDKRKKCAEKQMLQYIYTNVTYPAEAREAGIQGMAVISFVVETDGQITHLEILRSLGYEIDKEVIRIVENMPDWIPGIHEGKAVRVKFNLPVRFKLES